MTTIPNLKKWRCSGCGAESVDTERTCDCPTNYLFKPGGGSTLKTDGEAARATEELRNAFWRECVVSLLSAPVSNTDTALSAADAVLAEAIQRGRV